MIASWRKNGWTSLHPGTEHVFVHGLPRTIKGELVALSDYASQAVWLRNFIISQGYNVGPVILHQDNLSCMALIKRGGPASERSRHIDIRYFWVKELVDGKIAIVKHLPTDRMHVNVLTKPVQGRQFILERNALTNWV